MNTEKIIDELLSKDGGISENKVLKIMEVMELIKLNKNMIGINESIREVKNMIRVKR